MKKNHNSFILNLVLFVCILAAFTATTTAKEPAGLKPLLSTAAADNDRNSFDNIVAVALRSWPGDKIDILKLIEIINPEWLTYDQSADLLAHRLKIKQTIKRERARGLLYYIDPGYWSPKAELGAGTSSGDTNEKSIAFGLSLSRDFSSEWSHNLRLNFDFARRGGITSRERLEFIEDTFWNVFNKGFLNNFTQFEIDRFSGFTWRLTQNLGLAYQLIKNKAHSLRVQGGPGFRISRLLPEIAANGLVVTPAFTRREFIGRISADYGLDLGDGVKLNQQLSAVVGSISTRLDNNLTLSAQINSSLSARVRFNVVYESDVPLGTSNVDTVTRATIVYTF